METNTLTQGQPLQAPPVTRMRQVQSAVVVLLPLVRVPALLVKGCQSYLAWGARYTAEYEARHAAAPTSAAPAVVAMSDGVVEDHAFQFMTLSDGAVVARFTPML